MAPRRAEEQRSADPPRAVLERCLAEPGYTPPQRCLAELLAVLSELGRAERELLERAIARAGAAAVPVLLAALDAATSEQRPQLLALGSRLSSGLREPAPRGALLAALLGSLGADEAMSRKWAARALGKLADGRAEPPLLQALASWPPNECKSVLDALALLGGASSLEPLRRLEPGEADLARRRERALLLIERRLSRSQASSLLLDRPLSELCAVVLRCRAGLAELLRGELLELGLCAVPAGLLEQPRGPAVTSVQIAHSGTLRALLGARTALDVALRVPLDPGIPAAPERIAAALTQPETLERIARWTEGLPRFRIAWSEGGHRRAQAWAVAQAVRRRTTRIANDSHAALWTARVRADAVGQLDLVPRLDPDPRFAYRVSDVPAASHPTIAAALARVAGLQAGEVVWDPFVGSALELVERARLGPCAELWGSDIDRRALAAARANLDAAGWSSARLLHGSALELAPAGVSLILTNPPMGRRVARDGSLAELLERFIRHAAGVLRPSGRLVWLSPLSKQTERVALACGLGVTNGADVDLGGFSARLQVFQRRS